jgi:hypothetical protein
MATLFGLFLKKTSCAVHLWAFFDGFRFFTKKNRLIIMILQKVGRLNSAYAPLPSHSCDSQTKTEVRGRKTSSSTQAQNRVVRSDYGIQNEDK